MISIRNLHKCYDEHQVLRGVNLDIEETKLFCIIGRSGCGKSTMLRCLNGLEILDSGSVQIGSHRIEKKSSEEPLSKDFNSRLHRLRQSVGMVFQNFNLFPHLTLIENVMKAPVVVKKVPIEEARFRAETFLTKVGLQKHFDHYPHHLSGGQQQRGAIARALAMQPKVMLYDEPTSALDPELVDEVLQVMKTLDSERMTQIVVTHEMRFARDAADAVVYMEEGQVVEVNPPEKIFAMPDEERTRQFLRKFIS